MVALTGSASAQGRVLMHLYLQAPARGRKVANAAMAHPRWRGGMEIACIAAGAAARSAAGGSAVGTAVPAAPVPVVIAAEEHAAEAVMPGLESGYVGARCCHQGWHALLVAELETLMALHPAVTVAGSAWSRTATCTRSIRWGC